MEEVEKQLVQALETGFINRELVSRAAYQPDFVVNDRHRNETIHSYVERQLRTCDEFWIAAAFLTTAGRLCLHNAFKEFDERSKCKGKGKGRIFVSDYLAFTHPEALRKIRMYGNIETRLVRGSNYHGKGYLFKSKGKDGADHFDFMIGSTNLSPSALKVNNELNVRLHALGDSKIVHDFKKLFNSSFDSAQRLNDAAIEEYEHIYNARECAEITRRRQEEQEGFVPNQLQHEALESLASLRRTGNDRALVVSATGSGKTVLAAMDAKRFGARRLLFVVHRSNIAKKAMETFKIVFSNSHTMGLYSGQHKDLHTDFVFATVQTINSDKHLSKFAREEFDYIIIDETHRAGALTYQRVLDYFKPRFLLGMTATPERTDGFDIFSIFKHNIGYEIRLQRALEAKLVCPFHYFGISDIEVDGRPLDELADFNNLVCEQRVDHIVNMIEEHGTDSGELRGLVFCSSVEEASNLAGRFNDRGMRSVALSGKSSETSRQQAIDSLESDDSDRLQFIFTVDIFNEGIDIPKLNLVLLLRPTQSAIVFVQQLGRGLRKTEGKEFLTVIDFVGNYGSNYLIPVALFGDRSMSKDVLRKLINSGSDLIPGTSTVHFDEKAMAQICASINNSNLQTKKDLLHDYQLLRFRLGRRLKMVDFLKSEARDPYQYVKYAGSFYKFATYTEDPEELPRLPPQCEKLIEYQSKLINNVASGLDSLLLLMLMKNNRVSRAEIKTQFSEICNHTIDDNAIAAAGDRLNLMFHKENKDKALKPVGEIYKYQIVERQQDEYTLGVTLENALQNEVFSEYLEDSARYSVETFKSRLVDSDYVDGFIRYQKYSRVDVFRMLNWPACPSPMINVGGYKVSADRTNCPIFVTYDKAEGISASTRYRDEFLSSEIFSWMSKSNKKLDNTDVKTIVSQASNGIRLPLFIKKSDDEGHEHYYIGDLTVIDDRFSEQAIANDKGKKIPVVNIEFAIDKPVEEKLYRYITEA